MTKTTTNGQDTSFDMDGLEKMTGILSEVSEKLEEYGKSLNTGEGEFGGLNTGETDGFDMEEDEYGMEDDTAELIAAPLVNALNTISGILEDATLKILGLTGEED